MIDIVAAELPYITPPGGLIYAPKGISLNVGGHSANTAIDLAQLGQYGVTATGCIGDDPLGNLIVKTLQIAGIEAKPQIHKQASTAKNIALTVEGEDRRFIAELAANTLLSPYHIIELIKKRPRLLYLGTIGGLKYVDESLRKILVQAKAVGAATLVDVIPPTKPDWKHLFEAVNYIDILHCNRHEAYLITGESDPTKALTIFKELGVRNLIISLGKDGVIALAGGSSITMPAFTVKEVDTTGAGDALCAGMIHGLLATDPLIMNEEVLIKALLRGQAAGAACVTSIGATGTVTKQNVDMLIMSQGQDVLNKTIITTL